MRKRGDGFSGNSTTAKSDTQSHVISRPPVPFDLPKSRLPSVFHPTARQSCSLGSKRFGTDLSKLYGTTPISDLFPSSLFPSLSPSFSFARFPLLSPFNLLPATTSNPRHYQSYKDFFPFSGLADKSQPGSRIFASGVFLLLYRSRLLRHRFVL